MIADRDNIKPAIKPPRVFLPAVFVLICLTPWIIIQSRQAVSSNILWLCEALRRLLAGGSLSGTAYETNPPLNILLYILPVLAEELDVPLPLSLFIQTLGLALLSSFAIWSVLSSWPWLEKQTALCLAAAALFYNTVGTGLFFGERDHYSSLALLPFALIQITLTFRPALFKKIWWPVLAFGAVLLLVKPHYGLLPSLLIGHRLIHRRSLRVLRNPDFICLAAATTLYLLLTPLIFPDYVSTILPDVLELYVPMRKWGKVSFSIFSFILVCTGLEAVTLIAPLHKKDRLFLHGLIIAGLLNLVPFWVQGMGLPYHLLPANFFIVLAACFLVMRMIDRFVADRTLTKWLSLILIVAVTYITRPLNIDYIKGAAWKTQPVSRLVRQCGNPTCSFFIFNADMGIIYETAYYNHAFHASRFPCFWFMPVIQREKTNLDEGRPSTMTRAHNNALLAKYSGMVAEDLKLYKPSLILIWQPDENAKDINFLKFFTNDESFTREWSHYKKAGTYDVSYKDYYPMANTVISIIHYDLYRRLPDALPGTTISPP